MISDTRDLLALLVTIACALVFVPTDAHAGTRSCADDRDVRWFIDERDRAEQTLLTAWVNGQADEKLVVRLSARIMAWETRLATVCQDSRFVARHVHLLHLDNVDVPTIPARLFLATMQRDGLLDADDPTLREPRSERVLDTRRRDGPR